MAEGRLKGVGALLLGAAGLITAVGAILRPESKAESAYGEVAPILLEAQQRQQKDHDDLVALREFLTAYVHSHEAVVTPVVSVSSSSPLLSPIPSPIPTPTVVHAAAPPSAAPPPHVAAQAAPRAPRPFDAL